MDFIISLIIFLPFFAVVAMFTLDSLFRALFLYFAWRSVDAPPRNQRVQREKGMIAYVFPAHDEEPVIAKSVAGLSVPTYVIADNCRDNTAEAAREPAPECGSGGRKRAGGRPGRCAGFSGLGLANSHPIPVSPSLTLTVRLPPISPTK